MRYRIYLLHLARRLVNPPAARRAHVRWRRDSLLAQRRRCSRQLGLQRRRLVAPREAAARSSWKLPRQPLQGRQPTVPGPGRQLLASRCGRCADSTVVSSRGSSSRSRSPCQQRFGLSGLAVGPRQRRTCLHQFMQFVSDVLVVRPSAATSSCRPHLTSRRAATRGSRSGRRLRPRLRRRRNRRSRRCRAGRQQHGHSLSAMTIGQHRRQQARIGQPAAALHVRRLHQRGVTNHQLQQFVAEVAVQHHVESWCTARERVAQAAANR